MSDPVDHSKAAPARPVLLPVVQALCDDMDALDRFGAGASVDDGTGSGDDDHSADSPLFAAGGGLGSPDVTAEDVEALARLHHRLSAQLARVLRGPIRTPAPDLNAAVSGPLIDYDHAHRDESPGDTSDPDDSAGDESERPVSPSIKPDGDVRDGRPAKSDDSRAGLDLARAGVPFGVQAALASAAWSVGPARSLMSAGRFVERFPVLDRLWRDGQISVQMIGEIIRGAKQVPTDREAEFVTAMARFAPTLTHKDLRVVAEQLVEHLQPGTIDDDEDRKYCARSLVFSTYQGTVLIKGRLPKLEGQLFTDAIRAIAESQRSEGDALMAEQRNADALIELLTTAVNNGAVPKLGGLPVAVTLTMTPEQAHAAANGAADGPERDEHGPNSDLSASADQDGLCTGPSQPDAVPTPPHYPDGSLAAWSAARLALCCGTITPLVAVDCAAEMGDRQATTLTDTNSLTAGLPQAEGVAATSDRRPNGLLARLARSKLLPLALGRAERLATTAQRKALAVRDRGCVIPGCTRPPNQTQPHHVTDYSLGGPTDLQNLSLLCWTHHRQVELGHWTLTRNPNWQDPHDKQHAPANGTSPPADFPPQPYWHAERSLTIKHRRAKPTGRLIP